MGRVFCWCLLGLATMSPCLAQDEPGPPQSLNEKASYVFGRDIIKDFEQRLVEYDLEQLIAGIRAAAAGQPSLLSEEDIASVMAAYGKELEKRQQKRFEEVADKNLRDGAEYLRQNALKDGVKQLESGLQYQVITEGDGPIPKVTDRVKIHFIGKSIAGTVFESTAGSEEPPTIAVGGIGIRGLVEAVMRMKTGSKWTLFVPPELAYGVNGAPPDIEPNQTLIFELELLEIVK
jgi:FKBP-type peptidyl-prolyl cis-trans isomerase